MSNYQNMYKKAKSVTPTDEKRRESNQDSIDKMNEPSQQTTQANEVKTDEKYDTICWIHERRRYNAHDDCEHVGFAT